MPTGASWGGAFDPADLVQEDWGSAALTFTSCSGLTVDYNSVQGARSLNLTKLISLAGSDCKE